MAQVETEKLTQIRSDAEGSFRAAAQMMHRVYPAWDGLHHAAISGESGFNMVFGQPLFDYLGTHPDLAPIFDAGSDQTHLRLERLFLRVRHGAFGCVGW